MLKVIQQGTQAYPSTTGDTTGTISKQNGMPRTSRFYQRPTQRWISNLHRQQHQELTVAESKLWWSDVGVGSARSARSMFWKSPHFRSFELP